MEYINPTAIAGMYNVPKENSLPGAGHGGFQGFLEGQAAKSGEQFLDMSKAGFAQDYVANQFKNQKMYEDYPLDRQAKVLANEGKASENAFRGLQGDQIKALLKKTDYEGKGEQYAAASGYAPMFAKASNASDMEKRGILDQFNFQMKQLFPDFQPANWDGSAKHWNQLVSELDMAGKISTLSKEYKQKEALQGAELGSREGIAGRNLSGQIRMNDDDNAARIRAAKIAASREGRGATSAELNSSIDQRVIELLRKGNLSPQEQAELQYYKNVRAAGVEGTMLRTDPQRVGAAAEAKSGGDIRGVINQVQKESGVGAKPTSKNPYADRLKAQGLDPDKYEVREENGRLKAYPK